MTVVADVHLSEHEPHAARRFVEMLHGLAGKGGTLAILGDLFDWWAGPETGRRPFEASILGALRLTADSGVRIAFVPGNRDFAFRAEDGLKVEPWPDLVRTRWGDRTVLLTHGDLLCSADRAYLRMRRFLRSGLARLGFRVFPWRLRAYLATGLRRHSARSGRHTRGAMLGIDYGDAVAWLAAHDADVLVAGHVHTGVHHRLPGTPPKDVYVLKDWDRIANVVRFDGSRVSFVAP